MNIRKLNHRSLCFVALTIFLFLEMLGVLYSAQIIYGQEYSEQSQRKQAETQEVPVARGAILDCYGRVLVSNELSYRLLLDSRILDLDHESSPDSAEDFQVAETKASVALISWLIETAEAQGKTWSTSLAISKEQPYTYTSDTVFYGTYQNEAGEDYRVLSRLGEFSLEMEWITDPREGEITMISAIEMIRLLAEEFGVSHYPWSQQRDMVAVLYDLTIRQKGIRHDVYCFAEDIDISFITKVKEQNVEGMVVDTTTKRVYGTEYAAHLLGRVSTMNEQEWEYYEELGYQREDKVGKEGAEQAFESYLAGESGIQVVESNGQGVIMSAYWEKEPVAGGNVVLTLDIDLQKKVEDVLAEAVPQAVNESVQGAACVLVDVNSGAVLAAGSYPTYDLALYGEQIQENTENPLNPLFNRAFQGTYAPGSTFKMVTGMAALEENILEPNDRIYDDGPFSYYEDYSPACWIYNQFLGTHGWQNISDALKNSCNYYFYEVGLKLGIDRIGQYASMFGLGEATGIELTEKVGVMAGPAYTESMGGIWYDGATLSVAIGQESSAFTPLQLANYIATLVNGGIRYEAHLLQEVKSSDFSQVLYTYDAEEKSSNLDFEEANLEGVKQGMGDLVSSGSVQEYFSQLRAMGIQVGGKTGTAQLTSESSASANAVFVCFAPYDNPEVAMTIVVEKGGSGNEAASIAAEILEYYFTSKENRNEIRKENTLIP